MVASENFLVPNGTFIIELVLFLVVLGVMTRFVLPPITKAMAERREQLRKATEEAEEGEDLLKESERIYRAKIDEARQESRSLIEQATRAGEQVRAEMQSRAKHEYDQAMAQASADIERATRQATEELQRQVADLVVETTRKALGREVDPELRRSLVGEAAAGAESHV